MNSEPISGIWAAISFIHSRTGKPMTSKTPVIIHTNNRNAQMVNAVINARVLFCKMANTTLPAQIIIINKVRIAPVGVNTQEKNTVSTSPNVRPAVSAAWFPTSSIFLISLTLEGFSKGKPASNAVEDD